MCDLSGDNPNVFWEFGIRTSLNLPIAVVRDGLLPIPFDTSLINTHGYKPSLNVWDIDEERALLAEHIKASFDSCNGKNPMWEQFGLTFKALEPQSSVTPEDAKLDLVLAQLSSLREKVTRIGESRRVVEWGVTTDRGVTTDWAVEPTSPIGRAKEHDDEELRQRQFAIAMREPNIRKYVEAWTFGDDTVRVLLREVAGAKEAHSKLREMANKSGFKLEMIARSE